jgi:acetoacetate decarboxylase
MTYPTAPWTLKGYAFQNFYLLNIEKVASLLPKELEIVSILPGKTLASVYFSAYTSGSVLEYNELIVAPAFVRYQDKMGAWISHIYVDHLDSVAGGREIWGLPKEMANFTWTETGVNVSQNSQDLCYFSYKKGWLATGWQQKLHGTILSGLNSELLFFSSHFQSKIALVKAKVEIPNNSPFYQFELGQPFLTLSLPQLTLIAGLPEVVGTFSRINNG